MSSWPRHRGPVLVPVSATLGSLLIVGLLVNGAHSRSQQVRIAQARSSLASTVPTTSPGIPITGTTPTTGVPSTTGTGTPSTSLTPSTSPATKVTAGPTPRYARPMTDAANAAVRAWQQPTLTLRTASLRSTATPEYIKAIASADPARVPKSRPAAAILLNDADGFARVSVTLADGTPLLVDLKQVGKRWLASNINPGT